jgi:uncharacterized RDD family membrane protein YckC
MDADEKLEAIQKPPAAFSDRRHIGSRQATESLPGAWTFCTLAGMERMVMDPHPAQDTNEVEAATRLSRLGAALVDGLVSFAPLGALALLLPVAVLSGRRSSLLVLILLAGAVSLAVLITQIVLLARNGQTIGKKVLGIRMITSAGDTPSLWRVFFLRWLPFAVAGAVVQLVFKAKGSGIIIHLVDVLLIFQPTRRCLHDLFADTHVIKARS